MLLGEENKVVFNYKGILSWVLDNIVTIIFVLFVLFGFMISKDIRMNYFLSELCDRLFRNSFLVLSLIIPVLAGLGLNFGIVIGAMCGQAAIALARYHGLGGMSGLLFCFVISFLLAVLCGYFTGKLYNKTRGQEMIAGLIAGFFANGVYQFIFLFMVGVIIKVPATHPLIMPNGIGVRMTVDLVPVENGGLKFALENMYKIPFVHALLVVALVALVILFIGYYLNKKRGEGYKNRPVSFGFNVLMCLLIASMAVYVMAAAPKLFGVSSNLNAIASNLNKESDLEAVKSELRAITSEISAIAANDDVIAPRLNAAVSDINDMIIPNLTPAKLNAVTSFIYATASDINTAAIVSSPNVMVSNFMQVRTVPVAVGLLIIGLCIFTSLIMRTKLGQDFRSVGQSQHIAEVSGINVDRTRIIATIISTVLAGWGQLIFIQSLGTLSTYSAHTQIGMFSVAALLVGGASTSRASVKNAIFGTILFNAMFIMSPTIGESLFGAAGLAEYFRTLMVYGVIGVALGLHVWKANKKNRIVVE
ncbi:MAG: hypothetical protein FWE49_00095 [Synergistaceae bacterium]|nr:hypothetical protein [Synergistaceae bacterium]